MAIETVNPAFLEPGNGTKPELLVCAVLHLMSHYTTHAEQSRGCARLASVIERHLDALADRHELSPVLRATCRQLAEQWSDIVQRSLRPAKPGLLLRIVAGTRGA